VFESIPEANVASLVRSGSLHCTAMHWARRWMDGQIGSRARQASARYASRDATLLICFRPGCSACQCIHSLVVGFVKANH